MCPIQNLLLYFVFQLLTNNEFGSCSEEYFIVEYIVSTYEHTKYEQPPPLPADEADRILEEFFLQEDQ